MMSTHQSDPFMFLPFRRGDAREPEWNVLIKYVKQHFPSNFNSHIQGAVDRLTQYKKVIAATCTNDLKQPPNEAFIEQTLKTYVQLIATAQAHLPLYGDTIKGLSSEWRDSLEDSYKHQSKNSNVEVFSCLHNLAASYSYIASVDAESGTVDGVKNAFKTFQIAAGCFQFAENFLKRLPPQCVVKDATVESQQLFQKLCMCQAHHCGYLKAEFEMKGKHALLSKIAVEGARLYDDAARTLVAQGWPKTNVVKDLEAYTLNMAHVFNARGHLHLAQERMDSGEVGDAIARYNHATHFLGRAAKFNNANMQSWLQGIKNTTADLHQKAVNANETVYFSRIPKELPPLEGLGKGLGRPTAVTGLTKVISNRDADPFFGIVPQHVAEIASKHFSSMQELVSSASKSVTSYRGRTRAALNAMGVAGTIESLSSESKDQGRIPEHLRAKIIALRGEGRDKLAEGLVGRTTQAEEILNACLKRVEEVQAIMIKESQNDESLAAQYGVALWRGYRPQSVLAPHSQEVHKLLHYQEEQIAKALKQPLAHIKVTLSSSLRDLARLDWPMDDLDALMPYTKTKAVKEQTKAVQESVEKLKKLVERFDHADEQNSSKLNELNALMQNDSVVHALSAVDVDQHEVILDAASNEIKDIVQCIQSQIASGDALLEAVEDIMNSLAVSRSEDATTVEIQQVCTMIESAIDLYQRLWQELAELDAAASQVLENLDGVVSSAQSFELSRQLEADDIKANIEYQIAAKLKEMDAKKSSDSAVLESQKRQEELRSQLEALEGQRANAQQDRNNRQYETGVVQQTLATASAEVDQRNDRMQQLLNQQRMAAQSGYGNTNPPVTYAPPPPQPPNSGYYAPPPPQHYPSYQQAPPQQEYQGPPPPQQFGQPYGFAATAPPMSPSDGQPYYSPPPQHPPAPTYFSAQPMQTAPQFGMPPAPPQGPPPPFYAQLPHPSNYHYEGPRQ